MAAQKGVVLSLENETAMISGGNSGIGLAVARVFARAGARLFLVARREQPLAAAAEELGRQGAAVAWRAADLVREGAAAEVTQAMLDAYGRIDHLVCSAGINRPQKAEEVSLENWDAVMNINVRALFTLCQAVGRHMIARGAGSIVNISSQAGAVALPLRAAYCSSKGAVNQLTRTLALEWSTRGVRVNAVAPTFIDTPFVAEMFKDPAFKDYVMKNIPLGRLPDAEEVAQAVLYLSSPMARSITGHILAIDGGWTIQ
jgi:NAD(P)-dependent dehydrogenase (short-subunit alcohol dehydrogenase family)